MANKKPLKAKTSARAAKKKFLGAQIQHIDITKLPGIVPVVESMQHMAYSSRDLGRAAEIYERMLKDKECGVILCLAGVSGSVLTIRSLRSSCRARTIGTTFKPNARSPRNHNRIRFRVPLSIGPIVRRVLYKPTYTIQPCILSQRTPGEPT